jgi:hypothetical protein
MAQKPTEITIPIDRLVYRIAWYEVHGMKDEATALRLLAADARPMYEVDESLVQDKIAYLNGLSERSRPFDL